MQNGKAFKKYVNNLFRDTIISIIFFTIVLRYHDVIDTNKICLTQLWENLSLNDREGGEFQFEKTTEGPNYTIAAKFLTKRALNTEAIIKTFNSIWRSKNGFKVRNVGNHILLFVFDNEEEVERIFEGEPWNFD